MRSPYRAAVIIPHFNDSIRLTRCLQALTPHLDQTIEVVVVDNGSTEDLSIIAQAFPQIRLVTEQRKGAAEARNRGVAETSAPLLFFLDCDCIPNAEWIRAAFSVAGSADVVGGQVGVFHEGHGPLNGAQAFEAVFAFDNKGYIEKKRFSVTANLVTNRAVFESVGGFRAGVSEDLDWCRRAVHSGYTLAYAHELQVLHPSRGDWGALRRKWVRLNEEGFGVNGSGPTRRLIWGAKAVAMPLSILAHLPKILRFTSFSGDPTFPERLGGQGLTGAEKLKAIACLIRLRLARMAWMLRQAGRG